MEANASEKEEETKMSEWNKITDKPPEFPCLVYQYLDENHRAYVADNKSQISSSITHWQKLEPPEPENKEMKKAGIALFGPNDVDSHKAWIAAHKRCAGLAEYEAKRILSLHPDDIGPQFAELALRNFAKRLLA